MIARTWSGRTKKEHAEAYLKVVLETGMPDICDTQGNQGALLLRRIDGEEAEFLLISLWESLESIKAFAGTEVERARYYSEDDAYLLAKPEKVVHYEVLHALNAD